MSRSSQESSKEHSRERMVTLPPIRDIFREQLTSPPYHASPRPSRSSYGSSSAYTIHSGELRSHASPSYRTQPSSPDVRFSGGESARSSPGSQRAAAPGLRPSLSYGTSFPEDDYRRPMPEHRRSHESSPSLPATQTSHPGGGYHYGGSTDPGRYMSRSGGDSSRSSGHTSSIWAEHRRRDSVDSAWSSHSSSSTASAQQHSAPPPPSNALQFQPLPQPQTGSSRAGAYAGAQHPNQTGHQSPFGVLIADPDSRAGASSDPQRTAIFRTLRASGMQGSFQINFDDPTNSQTPLRYSCQYCGKGFARPSSLRIHNNSHTGEKPFQCPHPDCGRRFSVHSNMRRHYRVHEGNAAKTSEDSADELADE